MRSIDELTGLTIEAIPLLTEERDERELLGLDEESGVIVIPPALKTRKR